MPSTYTRRISIALPETLLAEIEALAATTGASVGGYLRDNALRKHGHASLVIDGRVGGSKRGRAELSSSEGYRRRAAISLTPAQLRALRAAAIRDGMTLSDLVRTAVKSGIPHASWGGNRGVSQVRDNSRERRG